jgi:membrane-associated phospholipid phosphatase
MLTVRGRVNNLDRHLRGILLRWAIGLYALVIAMAPLVWHKQDAGPASPLDRWGRTLIGPDFTRALRDVHLSPTANGVFPHLVGLGSPRDVAAMVLLLALLSLAARDFVGFAMCAVGPSCAILLTEAGAKPFVGRVRNGAYQYPSGHCTAAAAVGALGLLLLYRRGGWSATRTWGWAFLVPPILVFIAMQRVGLHDLTESIAGLAVGMATTVASSVAMTTLAAQLRRREGPNGPNGKARLACRPDDRQGPETEGSRLKSPRASARHH